MSRESSPFSGNDNGQYSNVELFDMSDSQTDSSLLPTLQPTLITNPHHKVLATTRPFGSSVKPSHRASTTTTSSVLGSATSTGAKSMISSKGMSSLATAKGKTNPLLSSTRESISSNITNTPNPRAKAATVRQSTRKSPPNSQSHQTSTSTATTTTTTTATPIEPTYQPTSRFFAKAAIPSATTKTTTSSIPSSTLPTASTLSSVSISNPNFTTPHPQAKPTSASNSHRKSFASLLQDDDLSFNLDLVSITNHSPFNLGSSSPSTSPRPSGQQSNITNPRSASPPRSRPMFTTKLNRISLADMNDENQDDEQDTLSSLQTSSTTDSTKLKRSRLDEIDSDDGDIDEEKNLHEAMVGDSDTDLPTLSSLKTSATLKTHQLAIKRGRRATIAPGKDPFVQLVQLEENEDDQKINLTPEQILQHFYTTLLQNRHRVTHHTDYYHLQNKFNENISIPSTNSSTASISTFFHPLTSLHQDPITLNFSHQLLRNSLHSLKERSNYHHSTHFNTFLTQLLRFTHSYYHNQQAQHIDTLLSKSTQLTNIDDKNALHRRSQRQNVKKTAQNPFFIDRYQFFTKLFFPSLLPLSITQNDELRDQIWNSQYGQHSFTKFAAPYLQLFLQKQKDTLFTTIATYLDSKTSSSKSAPATVSSMSTPAKKKNATVVAASTQRSTRKRTMTQNTQESQSQLQSDVETKDIKDQGEQLMYELFSHLTHSNTSYFDTILQSNPTIHSFISSQPTSTPILPTAHHTTDFSLPPIVHPFSTTPLDVRASEDQLLNTLRSRKLHEIGNTIHSSTSFRTANPFRTFQIRKHLCAAVLKKMFYDQLFRHEMADLTSRHHVSLSTNDPNEDSVQPNIPSSISTTTATAAMAKTMKPTQKGTLFGFVSKSPTMSDTNNKKSGSKTSLFDNLTTGSESDSEKAFYATANSLLGKNETKRAKMLKQLKNEETRKKINDLININPLSHSYGLQVSQSIMNKSNNISSNRDNDHKEFSIDLRGNNNDNDNLLSTHQSNPTLSTSLPDFHLNAVNFNSPLTHHQLQTYIDSLDPGELETFLVSQNMQNTSFSLEDVVQVMQLVQYEVHPLLSDKLQLSTSSNESESDFSGNKMDQNEDETKMQKDQMIQNGNKALARLSTTHTPMKSTSKTKSTPKPLSLEEFPAVQRIQLLKKLQNEEHDVLQTLNAGPIILAQKMNGSDGCHPLYSSIKDASSRASNSGMQISLRNQSIEDFYLPVDLLTSEDNIQSTTAIVDQFTSEKNDHPTALILTSTLRNLTTNTRSTDISKTLATLTNKQSTASKSIDLLVLEDSIAVLPNVEKFNLQPRNYTEINVNPRYTTGNISYSHDNFNFNNIIHPRLFSQPFSQLNVSNSTISTNVSFNGTAYDLNILHPHNSSAPSFVVNDPEQQQEPQRSIPNFIQQNDSIESQYYTSIAPPNSSIYDRGFNPIYHYPSKYPQVLIDLPFNLRPLIPISHIGNFTLNPPSFMMQYTTQNDSTSQSILPTTQTSSVIKSTSPLTSIQKTYFIVFHGYINEHQNTLPLNTTHDNTHFFSQQKQIPTVRFTSFTIHQDTPPDISQSRHLLFLSYLYQCLQIETQQVSKQLLKNFNTITTIFQRYYKSQYNSQDPDQNLRELLKILSTKIDLTTSQPISTSVPLSALPDKKQTTSAAATSQIVATDQLALDLIFSGNKSSSPTLLEDLINSTSHSSTTTPPSSPLPPPPLNSTQDCINLISHLQLLQTQEQRRQYFHYFYNVQSIPRRVQELPTVLKRLADLGSLSKDFQNFTNVD